MSKAFLQWVIVAGAVLAPGVSSAQSWKFSGQAGVSATYFQFEETVDGDTLNEETGTVPVLNLQGFVESPIGLGIGLYYSRASDTLDYEGQSQLGGLIASESDLEWSDLAVALAYQWRGNWFAAGWGRDQWERDIAATTTGGAEVAGLLEERTMDYIFFGIARNLHSSPGFTLGIKTQLDFAYDVDFTAPAPEGYQGPVDINGGAAAGARLSLPMSWNVWEGLNLGVTPYLQYWWVEDRNGTQVLQPIPPNELPAATADRPEASMLAVGISFSLSFGN